MDDNNQSEVNEVKEPSESYGGWINSTDKSSKAKSGRQSHQVGLYAGYTSY